MPFEGFYPAPKLTPSEFGLFGLAKPNTPESDSAVADRWVRGFAQEYDSRPNYVRNWDETSNTSDVLKSDAGAARHLDVKSFFIEVEDYASTLGVLGVDRFERVLKQLEAVSQKAVEAELWDGTIAQGESYTTPYLTKATSATVLNSGTALSARRALALLEFKIGEVSATGEQGVIHMTRDVFALLSSEGQVFMHAKNGDHLQTLGGTPIVVGSGYSGNGPVGVTGAAASDINKWIYATGRVDTLLGEPAVVNDSLAQAYDVSGNANDMRIKATRAAAVYFDTSIHLAVRVDLTA